MYYSRAHKISTRDLSGGGDLQVENLIYLFIADTKSIVWTHTLCRTQVDKNKQYRT